MEEPESVLETAVAASSSDPSGEPVSVAGPIPIGFHNTDAVRSGFVAAMFIWMLIMLPVGGIVGLLLKVFGLVGGGFVAVYLYSRRTGDLLTVAGGARIGWITGVLVYTLWIIYITIGLVVLQEPGGWAEVYRKQLEESKAPAETLQQMNEIMQSPEMLGMMMVLVLLIFFVLITLPMVVGGAVAAKALERD